MTKTYLPGGHLVTINNLPAPAGREMVQPRQRRRLGGVGRPRSHPHGVALRGIEEGGIGKSFGMFKDNAFLWLYANYVRRLGHYLVELYSGRLKIGVGPTGSC